MYSAAPPLYWETDCIYKARQWRCSGVATCYVEVYCSVVSSSPSHRLGKERHSLGCLRDASFFARRKKHYEACALGLARSPATFYANSAMMAVHNPGDNRQPQAHAGFLRGHKRIEDLFPQILLNAWPRVLNPHLNPVAVGVAGPQCRDPQRASAIAHGIIGILNQIHERLLTKTLIQGNRRQVRFVLPLDAHWRVFAFLH